MHDFNEIWEEYQECNHRLIELDFKIIELVNKYENAGGIDYSKIPNEPTGINLQLFYVEYKREIEEEQRALNLRRLALKNELESMIRARIKGDLHRQCARKRIIDMKKSDMIARELGYSESHIRTVVSDVFRHIKKKDNQKSAEISANNQEKTTNT